MYSDESMLRKKKRGGGRGQGKGGGEKELEGRRARTGALLPGREREERKSARDVRG